MKTTILVLPALIAGFALIPAGRATAQTFTDLYSFTALPPFPGPYTNSDGANSQAGLILSGNTLYGTAYEGGSAGLGSVFRVNTDGTSFTNLHNFTGDSDGANPRAGLVLSGNTLYGTAYQGGSGSAGAVFKVNTDGSGYTNLHSFAYDGSGASPRAGLVLSGNTLYGTTYLGGSDSLGALFKVNTDGSGYTNLHSFAPAGYDSSTDTYTNSDGAKPLGRLILSGNTLYGTASEDGSLSFGTVFRINTNGTAFTNLHNFAGGSGGAGPAAGLLLSGNTLYGTTAGGGSSYAGTVFAVNTDGTGFTNLHSLIVGSDGGYPYCDLILSGNALYGTAQGGTLFAVNTNGTSFTNLWNFSGGSAGAGPQAGLVSSGNTFYGTAGQGDNNSGMVFSLSLESSLPYLNIFPSGAKVILTWPTNFTGFTLQASPNPGPAAAWSTNLPAPVVVNGQYAVTNPISAARQFYRLSK